ncbi:hypothetical protein ACFL6G_04270 [candidate division KSB1 bacterium]
MNLIDFDIIVRNVSNIPDEYKTQLFNLEYDTFSQIYNRCPKNLFEFSKRYNNKRLVLFICHRNHEILGYRIFEVINNEQVNSMVMIVKKEHRGEKISNLLSALSVEYFRKHKYKYITSWTHIEITAAEILAKFAPFLSKKSKLIDKECELLRNLEKYWNKKKNLFGNERIVKDFYIMLNNKPGDAMFWVHIL